MPRILATILLLILIVFGSFSQTTKRVPQDYATIQAAINAAVNGDTVLVAEGTYPVHLKITKKIVLASLFILDGDTSHISRTILDGSAESHVDSGSVVFLDTGTDTTTVVCGFTITRGKGMNITFPGHYTRYGGGVAIEARAGGTIRRNIISGNTVVAPSGGVGGAAGVCVNNGDMLIRPQQAIIEDNVIENNTVTPTDVTSAVEVGGLGLWGGNGRICRNIIRNNRVYWANTSNSSILGGGVLIGTDASMEMRVLFSDNIVEGNRSYRGGGLAVYGGATIATVRNNIFINNTGDYLGGGISLSIGATNTIVSGNYFARNSSSRGGGIGARNTGSNTIVNNIIVNNTSTSMSGAGIYVYDCSDIRIVNNTVAFNQGGAAHALFIGESATGLTSNKILNCIFWGASTPSIAMNNSAFHLVRSCLIKGGWATGTDIIDSDPFFSVDDTLFHLQITSPCVGTGVASATMGGILVTAPDHDYDGGLTLWRNIGAQSSITGVEDLQEFPSTFALNQNFPNPFNPSTTIRFSLPHASNVRLTVYNLLGQKIEELINEQLSPGLKQVTWNATAPSGMYLCTLEAEDGTGQRFRETKRMLLLK